LIALDKLPALRHTHLVIGYVETFGAKAEFSFGFKTFILAGKLPDAWFAKLK